jgi:hypothetical protein
MIKQKIFEYKSEDYLEFKDLTDEVSKFIEKKPMTDFLEYKKSKRGRKPKS